MKCNSSSMALKFIKLRGLKCVDTMNKMNIESNGMNEKNENDYYAGTSPYLINVNEKNIQISARYSTENFVSLTQFFIKDLTCNDFLPLDCLSIQSNLNRNDFYYKNLNCIFNKFLVNDYWQFLQFLCYQLCFPGKRPQTFFPP